MLSNPNTSFLAAQYLPRALEIVAHDAVGNRSFADLWNRYMNISASLPQTIESSIINTRMENYVPDLELFWDAGQRSNFHSKELYAQGILQSHGMSYYTKMLFT